MSTARIQARIPPIGRRIPVAKRLDSDSASDFKARKMARERQAKLVFWGVFGAIAGVICICFLVYLAIGLAKPSNGLASFSKPESKGENSSTLKVGLNKPFLAVSDKGNKFEITIKEPDIIESDGKRYVLHFFYSYKNLGPRDDSLFLAQRFGGPPSGEDLRPCEIKNEKGNIYGGAMVYDTESWKNKEEGVKYTGTIDETGIGKITFALPCGSAPAEIMLGGELAGNVVVAVPKNIQEKLKRESKSKIEKIDLAKMKSSLGF